MVARHVARWLDQRLRNSCHPSEVFLASPENSRHFLLLNAIFDILRWRYPPHPKYSSLVPIVDQFWHPQNTGKRRTPPGHLFNTPIDGDNFNIFKVIQSPAAYNLATRRGIGAPFVVTRTQIRISATGFLRPCAPPQRRLKVILTTTARTRYFGKQRMSLRHDHTQEQAPQSAITLHCGQ